MVLRRAAPEQSETKSAPAAQLGRRAALPLAAACVDRSRRRRCASSSVPGAERQRIAAACSAAGASSAVAAGMPQRAAEAAPMHELMLVPWPGLQGRPPDAARQCRKCVSVRYRPPRLLTQHMYRLSLRCTDFATAATADSAWEPANVKLLYTSDIYGQQISRASYDAGVTKPHCTTPTRTRVQVTTQYGTNTGHVIDRTCMHAAGGQVAGVLRTHRAQLPPDA